jgi:hypothetical protein
MPNVLMAEHTAYYKAQLKILLGITGRKSQKTIGQKNTYNNYTALEIAKTRRKWSWKWDKTDAINKRSEES